MHKRVSNVSLLVTTCGQTQNVLFRHGAQKTSLIWLKVVVSWSFDTSWSLIWVIKSYSFFPITGLWANTVKQDDKLWVADHWSERSIILELICICKYSTCSKLHTSTVIYYLPPGWIYHLLRDAYRSSVLQQLGVHTSAVCLDAYMFV